MIYTGLKAPNGLSGVDGMEALMRLLLVKYQNTPLPLTLRIPLAFCNEYR